MNQKEKSADNNQLAKTIILLIITLVMITAFITLQKRLSQVETSDSSQRDPNNFRSNLNPRVPIEQSILDFEQQNIINSREEAKAKLEFFQHIIENVLYKSYSSAKIKPNEKFFQGEFMLAWCDSNFSLHAEVNNGRGPVDFIVSNGLDKTLIEFKMATNFNSKSKNQVEIYKKVNKTENCFVAVFCLRHKEVTKAKKNIEKYNLDRRDVIVIDASPKKSASKA